MGKTLVIAEKPSVAGDIARAIGGLKKSETTTREILILLLPLWVTFSNSRSRQNTK